MKQHQEEICPECGLHAPKKQIDNLEMCERCSLEGKVKTASGETLNPKNNILHRWKLDVTTEKTTPILP